MTEPMYSGQGTAAKTREAVRALISRDLKPVRPLWSTPSRLLVLVPVVLAAGLLGPLLGTREDIGHLGLAMAWGLWALQVGLGILVLGTALNGAVPGSGVSEKRTKALVVLVGALMLSITFATYKIEPTVVPPRAGLWFWYVCVVEPVKLALPLLAVGLVLTMRAFPTSPGRVGALCGFAAGIFSDSGWRLACWVSSPSHILNSHFLAVALLTLAGAGSAVIVDYCRRMLLPKQ